MFYSKQKPIPASQNNTATKHALKLSIFISFYITDIDMLQENTFITISGNEDYDLRFYDTYINS